MVNLELKAACPDLKRARSLVKQLGAKRLGLIRQTDTFFHCSAGLLKLREMPGQPAELIWYRRSKRRTAKKSEYHIYYADGGADLRSVLQKAYGKDKVVRKKREVYLYQHVRIHLDRVEKLGTFIEFEAVVPGRVIRKKDRRFIAHLQKHFGIHQRDLVEGAYADLLDRVNE